MAEADARIQAVGFDLDGTLIDTLPDLAAAVNLMLSMLGAAPLAESRVQALVGSGVELLVLRALAESLGHEVPHAAQRSAALNLFRTLYAQNLSKRSRVYAGVLDTLRSLRESGLALCCLTNKESRFAAPLLTAAGIAPWLDFTLCADRIEDRKPNPHLLLAACSRLGIAPAAMTYVGDSRADVSAAQAAGCQMIAVTYGYDRELAVSIDVPAGRSIDTLASLPAVLAHAMQQRRELRPHTTAAGS